MDERISRLKSLKKAYKRVRNRKVGLWRTLFWLLTVLILAGAGMWLYVSFYKAPVMRFVDLQLWTPIKTMLGLGNLRHIGLMVKAYALPAAGGLAVLWTLCLLAWEAGVKASRKTMAFLDYQTLKNTLDAEKEERREVS